VKDVADIFLLIVYVAMASVVLGSKNTVGVLSAIGSVFTGSIQAAKH
jgi:hypothetical protein